MERPNTIQLPVCERPEIDYALAQRCIRPMYGVIYTVEFPEVTKQGALYLPDSVSQSLKADLVLVIAVGEGVNLVPGDVLCVLPTDGTWIEGAVFGSYKAEGRVRVYGRAWDYEEAKVVRTRWHDSAPASMEDGLLQAKETKVIVKRDSLITHEGGLMLSEPYRPCTATVVSVGDKVRERLEPGMRVHYDATGVKDFQFPEDDDLAVIEEDAILAEIQEAA